MNILCYGDSNTWGYVPNCHGYAKDAVAQRYAAPDCWWYPLTEIDHALKINGLCGRSIAHENPWLANRNASATIGEDLRHYPNLDLMIVQLGTNDCKSMYHDSPATITKNLDRLLKMIRQQTAAQIMLISPAQINENTPITQKYYQGAQSKTIALDRSYQDLAARHNLLFVSGLALSVGEDGEHLTKQGHRQLGQMVIAKVKDINKDYTPELGR